MVPVIRTEQPPARAEANPEQGEQCEHTVAPGQLLPLVAAARIVVDGDFVDPVAQPCVQQVVVVDDCSTDGTLQQAQQFAGDARMVIRHHERNQGKGAAIRTGLEALKAPVVIIQDADMEYDPLEFDTLIAPVIQGRADVVYGVRGFAAHTAYSYWFVQGNRFVTTFTNVLFNCYIQDMETGYKLMRTSLMRRLHLRGDRFNIEPDITGRVLRLGYRIHEVPIHYYARGREEGKKLTWRDGVRVTGSTKSPSITTRAAARRGRS